MAGRLAQNWAICIASVVFSYLICFYLFHIYGETPAEVLKRPVGIFTSAFHLFVACSMWRVLGIMYWDTAAYTISYNVLGHPEYPTGKWEICYSGRWSYLTVWSVTIGAVYFALATVADAYSMLGLEAPRMLLAVTLTTWEIACPLAWLINLVVSFVLIPEARVDKERLGNLIAGRSIMLHVGFTTVAAIETALICPSMPLEGLPIVVTYGTTYVVFAWLLWARTGIYHYFFLDPRFDAAPFGVCGLLGLCATCYIAVYSIAEPARNSWAMKGLILFACAATSRWAAPDKECQDLGSLQMIHRCIEFYLRQDKKAA